MNDGHYKDMREALDKMGNDPYSDNRAPLLKKRPFWKRISPFYQGAIQMIIWILIALIIIPWIVIATDFYWTMIFAWAYPSS